MKKKLSLLILGDVFGSLGRHAVAAELPKLKKKYHPNLVIANAENLTHGAGISPSAIEELRSAGIDYFTGGNHMFDNMRGIDVLNMDPPRVLRPLNWHEDVPGTGFCEIDLDGQSVLLINLIGKLFMKQPYKNPFEAVEKVLARRESRQYAAILIDMHGEATSEKIGMGYFLDGTASLVWGTHTHVPTADERILPQRTGFITDVGMTGPLNSIIGMRVSPILQKFRYPNDKVKIEIEDGGEYVVNALYAEINPRTQSCEFLERIQIVGKRKVK